ncbi:unnamed protein product, partial [Ectocarpus sp. 8 AP-2014]
MPCLFFFCVCAGPTEGEVQGAKVAGTHRGRPRAPGADDPAPLPLQARGDDSRPAHAGERREVEAGCDRPRSARQGVRAGGPSPAAHVRQPHGRVRRLPRRP